MASTTATAWLTDRLGRIQRFLEPHDTFASRIGVALGVCMLVSVAVAAAVGYYQARGVSEIKEFQWMESELDGLSERLGEVSAEFSRFVLDLSKEEVISASLVDTVGRERHLSPFLRLVQASLARQFGSGKSGLNRPSVVILDFRGEPLGAVGGEPAQSVRGEAWLAKVLAGRSHAAYDDRTGELLVAHPIYFSATGQPEGIVLGRAYLGGFSDLDEIRRWRVMAGSPRKVAGFESDARLHVRARKVALAEPLQDIEWQVALGYPRASLDAEASKILWLYFVIVLGALVPLSLAAYLLGRHIGLPLRSLAARASRIAQSQGLPELESLDIKGTVEVRALARSFLDSNILIERSVAEMRLSRAALDSSREAIVISDATQPDLPLIYVNPAFEKITGFRRAEVLGRNCRFLHSNAQEQEGLDTLREALREQRECQVVLLNHRANGEAFWNELSVAPVRDRHGFVTHFVGIQKDITERKRAETRIRELQKLEAIGQLTGGLAHDFNNLLGVVVGNLDQIGEALPEVGEVREHHRAALDAALRGAEVTRSLLAVARRQPLEVGAHDLNGLLMEMLPLLRSSAGSAVSVLAQLCEGELIAKLDAGGLSNVVLNLVINARDAMKGEGSEKVLRVRTDRVRVESGEESLGLAPGEYAVLEVSDTGVGMSESVRAQAFEPFFTTKERGKGTGLGLAMVYGYAEQLGGTASLESEPGRGTTVRVYLPQTEQALEGPQERSGQEAEGAAAGGETEAWKDMQRQEERPGGGEEPVHRPRVLVVDDEPGLCDLACIWLRSLGYDVQGVNSPQQALGRLADGEYEILFTDVVMPGGMDGVMLARQALQMHPGLKVLLTSGYAKTLLEDDDPPGALLSKPYRKNDLARAFKRLGDGSGNGQ